MAAANSAAAPTTAPIRNGQTRERWRGAGGWCCDLHRHRQRVLALDDPARDVVGHRFDDRRRLVGFRKHDAAVTRVLHEAVGALVAAHDDVRDHVDPESRRIAAADAAVEQIDGVGNFGEQRIERFGEDFQPRHFGVAQVDDDAGAIGRLDPCLAQGIAQTPRSALACAVRCARGCVAHEMSRVSRLLTYQ